MGNNAPQENLSQAPQSGPTEVAANRQKDLRASVEANALISIRYKQGEWPRDEANRVDAITPEQNKNYTAVGEVNRVPFKQIARPYDWYLTMRSYAAHMMRDFDRIDFQFPSLKKGPKNRKSLQKMRDILQKISSASVDAAIIDDSTEAGNAFKSILDQAGNVQEIYGSEGVLNLVLAYGRASDTLKGITPGNAGSIDYKLKLSNNMASSLYERKQVDRIAEPIPAGVKVRDFVRSRAVMEKTSKVDMFNELMQPYAAKRYPLIRRVRALQNAGVLSSEEVTKYSNALTALDFSMVETRQPTAQDYDRYEHVVIEVDRIESELDVAEKNAKPKPEKKENVPVPPAVEMTPAAAPEEPRETVAAREHARRIESILNQGDILDRYAIDEKDQEVTVKQVVEDVIRACRVPVQFNLKTLSDLKGKLSGIVRARVNSAVSGGAKEVNFDAKDKKTLVEMVLGVVDYEKGLQGAASAELLKDKMKGVGY